MTILGLEACLLAPANLELDDESLKMLHQVNTDDLQLMQSVCLKLGCKTSEPISDLVDDRLIPAHSPVFYSPTPLFSIIDPQHANWNDNQLRHLYALSNPANEGIIKKKKKEGSISQGLGSLVVGSICMENECNCGYSKQPNNGVGVTTSCVEELVCLSQSLRTTLDTGFQTT